MVQFLGLLSYQVLKRGASHACQSGSSRVEQRQAFISQLLVFIGAEVKKCVGS